jgi:hypothetical protein
MKSPMIRMQAVPPEPVPSDNKTGGVYASYEFEAFRK